MRVWQKYGEMEEKVIFERVRLAIRALKQTVDVAGTHRPRPASGRSELRRGSDDELIAPFASIVAWPVAYYFLSKWLHGFAYRIDLGYWVFILSGIIALIIALASVSYQSIKAALANPVESLRYE